MPHDERLLISIVRRPHEVVAWVSERDAKAEEPQPFAIHSMPLDRMNRSVYPRKQSLQESWRYLSRVSAADEETLYHLLIVVIETVPDLSTAVPPPPLPRECYPLSASAAVKVSFRDYDHAFAGALGLPLYESYEGDDRGFEVSTVLAVGWWNDGSWDFNTNG